MLGLSYNIIRAQDLTEQHQLSVIRLELDLLSMKQYVQLIHNMADKMIEGRRYSAAILRVLSRILLSVDHVLQEFFKKIEILSSVCSILIGAA